MMVEMKPFRAEDAYKMDWIETEDLAGMLRSDQNYFYNLEQMGISTTMIDETGNILGIITKIYYHAQHVYLNMFMAKDIQKEFNKDIYKAFKEIVKNLTEQCERVSIDGKSSNAKLMKLIKSLGFKEEGVMRKYGWHGEDYTMFSIVKEG